MALNDEDNESSQEELKKGEDVTNKENAPQDWIINQV